MAPPKQTKLFPATLAHLPQILSWVESQCGSEKQLPLREIVLALEEAIVNIIHHAYKDKKGEIVISCERGEKEVTFTLRDTGMPFNPLKAEHFIDTTASLQTRKEGGLGLLLMKKYMSSLRYQREGNENVLTMTRSWE